MNFVYTTTTIGVDPGYSKQNFYDKVNCDVVFRCEIISRTDILPQTVTLGQFCTNVTVSPTYHRKYIIGGAIKRHRPGQQKVRRGQSPQHRRGEEVLEPPPDCPTVGRGGGG